MINLFAKFENHNTPPASVEAPREVQRELAPIAGRYLATVTEATARAMAAGGDTASGPAYSPVAQAEAITRAAVYDPVREAENVTRQASVEKQDFIDEHLRYAEVNPYEIGTVEQADRQTAPVAQNNGQVQSEQFFQDNFYGRDGMQTPQAAYDAIVAEAEAIARQAVAAEQSDEYDSRQEVDARGPQVPDVVRDVRQLQADLQADQQADQQAAARASVEAAYN